MMLKSTIHNFLLRIDLMVGIGFSSSMDISQLPFTGGPLLSQSSLEIYFIVEIGRLIAFRKDGDRHQKEKYADQDIRAFESYSMV